MKVLSLILAVVLGLMCGVIFQLITLSSCGYLACPGFAKNPSQMWVICIGWFIVYGLLAPYAVYRLTTRGSS